MKKYIVPEIEFNEHEAYEKIATELGETSAVLIEDNVDFMD